MRTLPLSIQIVAASWAASTGMAAEFFDDFSYHSTTSQSVLLEQMQWSFVEGNKGPGPTNHTWSRSNVNFTPDASNSENGLMELLANTQGNHQTCTQAGIEQREKRFGEGVYGARVRFTDFPAIWGDLTVQTFFAFNTSQPYSEIDFEYLAYDNGNWFGPGLYETTWGNYVEGLINNCAQPREITPNQCSVGSYVWRPTSLNGWHILAMVVRGGRVKYYLDGVAVADHGGSNYPDTAMAIAFYHWLGDLVGPSQQSRSHEMLVDWVYFSDDPTSSFNAPVNRAASFRSSGLARWDTTPTSRLLPVAPRGLRIEAQSKAATVQLPWDPNPEGNIQGYRIYYGRTGGGSTNVIDVGNHTTGAVTNLAYSTMYFFYVTAYNTFGLESDPSESLAYTTPPFTPLSVSLDPELIVLAPSEITLRAFLGGDRLPGSNLTISWLKTSGAAVTFTGGNTLTPRVLLANPGSYGFRVTVTEGANSLVRATDLQALDKYAAANRPDPIVLNQLWIPLDGMYFSWNGLTYRSYALAYSRQLGDRTWIPITPFIQGYTDHAVAGSELASFGPAFFSVFEKP